MRVVRDIFPHSSQKYRGTCELLAFITSINMPIFIIAAVYIYIRENKSARLERTPNIKIPIRSDARLVARFA